MIEAAGWTTEPPESPENVSDPLESSRVAILVIGDRKEMGVLATNRAHRRERRTGTMNGESKEIVCTCALANTHTHKHTYTRTKQAWCIYKRD